MSDREIGEIKGTLIALVDSHKELSKQVNNVYEKMIFDQRSIEHRLDADKLEVYRYVDDFNSEQVDPIRRDVQWLKNKYWLFVGAMTVVMVLINLLPWAVSLITEK